MGVWEKGVKNVYKVIVREIERWSWYLIRWGRLEWDYWGWGGKEEEEFSFDMLNLGCLIENVD